MDRPDVDRVAAVGAKGAGSARRPRCRAPCFPMGRAPNTRLRTRAVRTWMQPRAGSAV